MTIQDIQEKYNNILYDLRKKGSLNKIVLMLLLIAASLQAYIVINEKYYDQHWASFMTHGTLLFTAIGSVIFWLFLVLIMNSVSFINSKQIRFLNNEFKKNLFECIRKEIPEIRDYVPNQKIHPNVYYSSKLFQRKYDDYIGDDWMQGYYNGVRFELCELHVFKLFRVFFNGIFIRCKLEEELTQKHPDYLLQEARVLEFQNKYGAKFYLSGNANNLYLAVKMDGYFFENKNKLMLEKLSSDFNMLKELIEIIKEVINRI